LRAPVERSTEAEVVRFTHSGFAVRFLSPSEAFAEAVRRLLRGEHFDVPG